MKNHMNWLDIFTHYSIFSNGDIRVDDHLIIDLESNVDLLNKNL